MTVEGKEFIQALREAGLKVTQQRVALLSILMESTDHPNAEEIYVRVRGLDDSVSLATVYRTLSTLEEAGLVQRLNLENEPARFEITPAAAHDHLVDVDTGQVIELPSEEMNRLRNDIAAKLGYEIVSIHSFVRARKIKTSP